MRCYFRRNVFRIPKENMVAHIEGRHARTTLFGGLMWGRFIKFESNILLEARGEATFILGHR